MLLSLSRRMQTQLARVLQEVQWLGLRLDPNTEVQLPSVCVLCSTRTMPACLPRFKRQQPPWYHTDRPLCLPVQVASWKSAEFSIDAF